MLSIKKRITLIIKIFLCVALIVIIMRIPFWQLYTKTRFYIYEDIFNTTAQNVEKSTDKEDGVTELNLPKKDKKLSKNNKVVLYKNGNEEYISFLQHQVFLSTREMELIYTKNDIKNIKNYKLYQNIKIRQIKKNWYYVDTDSWTYHEVNVPLGYSKIERKRVDTHHMCLQDADTCYISYTKLYYDKIPNMILNNDGPYHKANQNNKKELLEKINSFEKIIIKENLKFNYDFVSKQINEEDYFCIVEDDDRWSFEIFVYDTSRNILYRFHGYD